MRFVIIWQNPRTWSGDFCVGKGERGGQAGSGFCDSEFQMGIF